MSESLESIKSPETIKSIKSVEPIDIVPKALVPSEENRQVTDIARARAAIPCSGCGYDLRYTKSNNCPECGTGFDWIAMLNRSNHINLNWLLSLLAVAACLPESFLKFDIIRRHRGLYYKQGEWDEVSQDYVHGTGTLYNDNLSFFENLLMYGSYTFWLGIPLFIFFLIQLRHKFNRLPNWLQHSLACSIILSCLLGLRRYHQLGHWFTGVSS